MREILFRGKRKDNGEWIEGRLLAADVIVPGGQEFILEANCIYGYDKPIIGYDVDEETVGQFTGLTDKSGKKIFEGDIVRAITLDTGTEKMAVVCFGNFIDENNGDEYIGFYIEFDGIKTTATQLAMEECKNRIEVIGNIHDNLELLEVEE